MVKQIPAIKQISTSISSKEHAVDMYEAVQMEKPKYPNTVYGSR